MASFGWNRPEWWESVSSWSPRDRLDVTALAYSLRAADAAAVVALMRDWNLSATDLPERALAAFPLKSDEVEPFLRSADALLDPEAAAAKMTERLIALAGRVNEVVLALNILDVWRHRHPLMVRHTDRCSCLMTCSSMPTGIRALDAAIQTYYEDHHERPVPECFGASDDSFRVALRPLIARSLQTAGTA